MFLHGASPRNSASRPRSSDRDGARLRGRDQVVAGDDREAEDDHFRGAVGKERRHHRGAIVAGAGDAATNAALSSPANDDGQDDERNNTTGSKAHKKRNRNIGALPRASPPRRCDDRTGNDDVSVLRGRVALHWRGRQRRGRSGSRGASDPAHDPPQIRLSGLRGRGGSGQGAPAPDRERHGLDGPRRIDSSAKFAWGSTLYRQTQILAGHGLAIDRQTLARWMKQAAWTVKGLYDLQLAAMHSHPRLFCDETPVRVLDPGRGRTKVCQFWAHATDDRSWKGPAPPAVAYVFAGGRGKREILTQLTGFEGVLQVDGYAAYASLAGDKKTSGKIRLAFCLVHARRNFVDVHKTTNSPFAKEVIERIAAVYAIEKRIRGLDADQRRAVRQAETKPLMEALKARLEATKDGISRQSTLVGAIDYALGRWSGLTLFLEDGRLEPDTNIVERSIRPISIGKKNSLFCGNEGGGETWAILATLLNTCKLHGVDPETYLTDVLERMVSGATKNNRLHELLVWNWKAAREAEKAAA